jgi:Cerato-platanin
MHFAVFMSTLVGISVFSVANGYTSATYDNTYDNPYGSLNVVACSNGENGLLTKGLATFGSLPSFPYIGGAQAVTGWDSPECGSCSALTYQGNTFNGEDLSASLYPRKLFRLSSKVLAIDMAATGLNIAQKALDELTNNQAVALGRVDVTAYEVAASYCGL